MSFTETFAYTAGQTDLYAYPASASYALSSTPWNANRVLATEVVAGFYSVAMDEAKSTVWSVFDGSAVPTSHDDAIATIRYEAPVSLAGVGPRTVTPTVTLGGQPAVGAVVRLTKNDGSSFRQDTTNSSGQVTFNCTDGTWIVAISYDGATFAGASLVVDGNETPAYTLTAISIPTSDDSKRTVYYKLYGNNGSLLVGSTAYSKCVKAPGSGLGLMGTERPVTSDASGMVYFTNCIVGATYEFQMGTGKKIVATIPAGSSAVALESIVGK